MCGKAAKEFLVTVESLRDYLQRQNYLSEQELTFITSACVFAESHYTHLTHPTGYPYLSYAYGIAKILASLGAEAVVIAAVLLYPPPLARGVINELKTQFKDKPDLLRLIEELLSLDQLEWDIWLTEKNQCESHSTKERRKIVQKMYLLVIDETATSDQERVDPTAAHFQKREKQVGNLIDMFFVAVSDFRPLMIKLADRLLFMKLLKDLNQTQKDELHYKQLAKITLAVYAPIADRLGIWRLKSELEDMSFRLLDPPLYKEIGRQLEVSKRQREQAIDQEIIPAIEEALSICDIQATVSGRAKHIYGVSQKMAAKQLDFDQINDLLGIRILVDTIGQCYEVQAIIHELWQPKTDFYDGNAGRDWVANPKQNMYQSLHTTIMMGEKIVEVQIRTYAMHEIAEYGVTSATYAAHWLYKESKTYKKEKLPREITPKDRKKMLTKLYEVQKNLPANPLPDHRDLLPMQKDRLKDRIFVITPKGHVIDFPTGATPLDFAYRIHTDLGNNYMGAKVNDHIVRLDYKLGNGQIVELIHSRMGKGPSPAWLTINKDEQGNSTYVFARTRQARQKIINKLHKMQKI